MNNMPGGYGGGAAPGGGGGMMPPGAGHPGGPIDHQQQQQHMMMRQQQQMAMMQQQQAQAAAAAGRGGMYPMQHNPMMMQHPGMYGMPQGAMDPAMQQRYQAAMVARQQQQQQQQQQQPGQMLEQMRNLNPEQRNHLMMQRQAQQQQQSMAARMYPGGMQQMQQPGAAATAAAAAQHMGQMGAGTQQVGGAGASIPIHMIKQEPGMMHMKQDAAASSMMAGQMQHGVPASAAAGAEDLLQQQQPANMARMQQARQHAAAMRMNPNAVAMQAGASPAPPGAAAVDPSMTVQQVLAAKAASAGGMQPHQLDPQQQQAILQQRQLLMQQQQAHAAMQQAQMQQRPPTAAPAAAAAAAAPAPAEPAKPSPAEEALALDFNKRIEALKEKWGPEVERQFKRHQLDNTLFPAFICRIREFFNGEKSHEDPRSMMLLAKLEDGIGNLLAKQSITYPITEVLREWESRESAERARGGGEVKKEEEESTPRARLLPDPWPLDVRARRIQVPSMLARHVRSRRMDERLMCRRRRHAEEVEEEEAPLWSARRMRYEENLEKELEELERGDEKEGTMMNGVACKVNQLEDHPPAIVNCMPRDLLLQQEAKAKVEEDEKLKERMMNLMNDYPGMPDEACKELCLINWRMVRQEQGVVNGTSMAVMDYVISIWHNLNRPLYVLIPFSYPEKPATILYDNSFSIHEPESRRLAEMLEKKLAVNPRQGRIETIAAAFKAIYDQPTLGPTKHAVLQHSVPSPLSESSLSSADSSPAAPPPTIPLLRHVPTTYRPPAKFVNGNAKSRMVY